MFGVIDRALWSGLLFLGLQFLFIGWKVRFDRSYVYFGCSILLMNLVYFGDVWVFPLPPGPAAYPPWTRLDRILTFCLWPFLLQLFSHAAQVALPRAFRYFLVLDAAVAVLLACEWPLFPGIFYRTEAGSIQSTIAGDVLFFPITIFSLALSFLILGLGVRRSAGAERRRILAMAAGWAAVGAGRLIDSINPSMSWGTAGPNYTLLGVTLFAVASVYLLMSRFLSLHRENRETIGHVTEAYAQLQAAARFKELGASAAIISHEIRNYVSTLKGNAALMGLRTESERAHAAESIGSMAEKLEVVSRDIAAYAGASVRLCKEPVALVQVIRDCLDRNFAPVRNKFRLELLREATVAGEAGRLEQVFLNVFKNAFEAGAGSVEVRLDVRANRVLVAVEDDGKGCGVDEIARMSEPFFTGRAAQGGSGLGCSIAEAILRAHGATMRAYSKNLLGDGSRGLVLNMVFPLAGPATQWERYNDILVASGDPEARDCMLDPLLNLGIRPLVLPANPSWDFRDFRNPLLLVDEVLADEALRRWGRGETLVAGRDRVARCAQPLSGIAGAPFLLSEENLARRLANREAA